jgi:hypothetical protein
LGGSLLESLNPDCFNAWWVIFHELASFLCFFIRV